MNRNNLRWVLPLTMMSVIGCASPETSWKATLATELPALGHRNWIVIADAAYPAQTRAGIQTVVTGVDQVEVVKAVLAAVGKASHVRPTVYMDAELPFVSEAAAPGVTAYREQLKTILGPQAVSALPHEEIIAKLDKAGELFKILLLKTTMTIPYTTVFVQLDCGYWSADAEAKLREAIKAAKP